MKPYESRLSYFHPKHHISSVNWSDDMNISLVEGYNFTVCQSMQNIQVITDSGGCNKYTIKCIRKRDSQNFVIVYTDSRSDERLVTKVTYIRNSKLSSFKTNEDEARENKRENSHASGKDISISEMFHTLLLYSEVATDLSFIDIATTPLEFRLQSKFKLNKNNDTNDGVEAGCECNNARVSQQ